MHPGTAQKKKERGARVKQDIILAGVGGQGILSIAFVIDNAALKEGLSFKQAEVHGMAQRGGAVQSHLRLSSRQIHSDLIPRGEADMLLSIEPLETLRYLDFLSPEGIVVTSRSPYINIPDYPDLDSVLAKILTVEKRVVVDSEKLGKEAGSSLAQNMVMLGAASPFLMLKRENLIEFIHVLFQTKGERIIEINLKAFELGSEASKKSGGKNEG
jgi:indolepyruvate ferredoxin oxidoreductase beta subunit